MIHINNFYVNKKLILKTKILETNSFFNILAKLWNFYNI